MAAMAMPGFHIGIEFEVLLLPHTDKELESSVRELHETKVRRLVEALDNELKATDETWPGLEMDYFKQGPHQRVKWAAVPDATIENGIDANRHIFGIEFVTPVLDFAPGSVFREHVQLFWKTLRSQSTVMTNATCGMHIHISLDKNVEGGGWTLEQVKAVARSWLYFEHAFSSLGPSLRYQTPYARRQLVHNASFAGCSLVTCYAQIDATSSINELVALMCDTGLEKILQRETHARERDWALSFLNASDAEGYLGTLEFRRPPGACSAEECLPWVELFVGFVQGALMHGTADEIGLLAFDPGMHGLQQFLSPVQGFSDLGLVEELMVVPDAYRRSDCEVDRA